MRNKNTPSSTRTIAPKRRRERDRGKNKDFKCVFFLLLFIEVLSCWSTKTHTQMNWEKIIHSRNRMNGRDAYMRKKKCNDYLEKEPVLISLCKILQSGIQFDLQYSSCGVCVRAFFPCASICSMVASPHSKCASVKTPSSVVGFCVLL